MKSPFKGQSKTRLLALAVYTIAAVLVIRSFGYYPPTKLTVTVKGPVPNSYVLYYDTGGGFNAADLVAHGTNNGGEFSTLEFWLPDREIKNVRLYCGYKTGEIIIKEMHLEGLSSGHIWKPEDMARDFEPYTDINYWQIVPGQGLLLRAVGAWPALTSVGAGFNKTFADVSQSRWLLYLIFIGLPVILLMTVPGYARLVSYLSFMLTLLVYSGVLNGISNITVVIFGGMAALCLVELYYSRKDFVLVLMGTFIAIFMVELGVLAHEHMPNNLPKKDTTYKERGWVLPDAELGGVPAPDFRQEASETIGNNYVFKDVVYTTDHKGRRSCPEVKQAKKHALFFGCSFTWGHGMRDDQTMPYCFQDMAGGEYQSYNYGFIGWGAAEMHHFLRDGAALDDVRQKEGIAVYDFIGDHISRTTPRIKEDRRDDLVFRLDKSGNLDGPFSVYDRKDLRAWLRLFGDINGVLVEASPSVRFFVNRFPFGPVSREERVKATAKVVIESKMLYDSRFKGEFYVVIYEKDYLRDDEIRLFVSMLRENGIHVIAVPRMPNPADENIHPLDTHPSAARNRWVAGHLLDEINNPSKPADIVLTR